MSHERIEAFIGNVMEGDYQTMVRAIDHLNEMTGALHTRKDPCLVSDILKVTELLDSRTRNHFQLEERMGACACLAAEKPRLEGELRTITREHRMLEGKLAAVRAAAEDVDRNRPETFTALARVLETYTDVLRRHEEHEEMMVMDAANLEIGAAD